MRTAQMHPITSAVAAIFVVVLVFWTLLGHMHPLVAAGTLVLYAQGIKVATISGRTQQLRECLGDLDAIR